MAKEDDADLNSTSVIVSSVLMVIAALSLFGVMGLNELNHATGFLFEYKTRFNIFPLKLA